MVEQFASPAVRTGQAELPLSREHFAARWLNDMHLIEAAAAACLDRLVGYYQPYATSHAALYADHALQPEIRNAAHLLAAHIRQRRAGKCVADLWPPEPRAK